MSKMFQTSSYDDPQTFCRDKYTVNVTDTDSWIWTDTERHFITIAIPICTVLGVLANSAFLFTVFRIRRMSTVVNFYLGSLAIADIWFLLFSMLYYFLLYFHSDVRYNFPIESSVGCWALYIAWYWGVFASLTLITVVSVDRYIAICHPFIHTAYQGKAYAAKCIFGTALVALALASVASTWSGKLNVICLLWEDSHGNQEQGEPLLVVHRSCGRVWENADIIVAIIIMVVYFAFLFITVVAYFKIIAALSKRRAKVPEKSDASIKGVQNQVDRVLVINGTVFFLCYFPNRVSICFYILNRFGITVLNQHQHQIFLLVSRILVLTNSTLNPFIYAFSSEFYRNAFNEAFGFRKRGIDDQHGTNQPITMMSSNV